MKKKICVVTGSRADYGLLYPLLKKLKAQKDFDLLIIATGMHLSPEFGWTYRGIVKDGFKITKKIKMLLPDNTEAGVTKSTGLGVIGFAGAFNRLNPDLVVLLGDRFEIFAAAVAAYIARIPIAHIQGGELTAGSLDDSFRHSITKMSLLHFVAAKEYKNRIMQLGEEPDRVFVVGALGIDNIKHLKLFSKEELEKELNFKLGERSIVVTFHPPAREKDSVERQFKELLMALEGFKDISTVFTFPNADANGKVIIKLIDDFVRRHQAKAFVSLGHARYLSLVKHAKVVVGNSSSGIIEAPALGKPTVNIGTRQKGRINADSVINCLPERKSIEKAIKKALSKEFADDAKKVTNPYGDGKAAERIVRIIRNKISKIKTMEKSFYDIRIK